MNNEQNNQNKKTEEVNFTSDNKELNKDKNQQIKPDGILPEDDPAVINPDELATFPEEVEEDPDIESERKTRATSLKSSPTRDGRNITRTDTTPDNDGGFM